jgi:hypothetical protein
MADKLQVKYTRHADPAAAVYCDNLAIVGQSVIRTGKLSTITWYGATYLDADLVVAADRDILHAVGRAELVVAALVQAHILVTR